MEAIIPYLTFNGNASEALDFYCKALNGEIVFKQTFGESPMESTRPAEAEVNPLVIDSVAASVPESRR